MKEVLSGLGLLVATVAILVAGYYLGIVMAVFIGALMALGIVVFLVVLLTYSVWDLFHHRKQQRRDP